MSAQPGHACLLDQVAQPAAAQSGAACLLEQSIAVARRLHTGLAAPWQLAALERTAVVSPMQITAARDHATAAPWHIAHPRRTGTRSPWGITRATDTARHAPWHRYTARAATPAAVPWGITAARDTAAALPWGTYTGRPAATAAPGWATPLAADTAAMLPWGVLTRWQHLVVARIAPSRPAQRVWVLPWVRYSRPLDAGWGVVIEDGAAPTDEHGTILVPILGAYIVLNEVYLTRADTGEPIEVEQFSASIDADSWTWGWSATLHADLMPLVRSPAIGQHVELIATLNGTPLRLVVERMGRDRRFADRRLKVSGRGRAAWLGDPHSPVSTRYNTQQMTAQQILAAALTLNGVPIGWTLDWRITDWQVPAGAWSHTGTYLDAALRIAEAGGAYVQAHNTDQSLIILPRYPAAPWNWPDQTPDIDLPEDVVEVEGIEWHDKPNYNAVWIAGAEGGRRDRIRRTGTAADRYAPSIVDPLATAPEMTRQRGLAILGDTGRQAHISLRLPVLPETGIIQPGHLVRYTESGTPRLGLTRAVSIDHRFPELWQTIRLETHEIEPV